MVRLVKNIDTYFKTHKVEYIIFLGLMVVIGLILGTKLYNPWLFSLGEPLGIQVRLIVFFAFCMGALLWLGYIIGKRNR